MYEDCNKNTCSAGAIVFLVEKDGKYLNFDGPASFGKQEKATVWYYDERADAEECARISEGTVESWLSRDGKLILPIPIEAVQ